MSEWPFSQKWHEKIQFPGHLHTLEINAASYNDWVREICPLVEPEMLKDDDFETGARKEQVFVAERDKSIVRFAKSVAPRGFMPKPPPVRKRIDLGDGWSLAIRTLPYYHWGPIAWFQEGLKRSRLAIYDKSEWDDCYNKAAVMFDGPVHIPVLFRGNRPWMSLTPMEIYTLREALKYAEGSVLVAGLGMGWLTRRILELPDVTHVTQVEIEPKILQTFGLPLKEEFGDRLTLVQADIWEFLEGSIDFDSYIFDIWPALGDAEEDEDFQALKEERDNVWGWGDAEMCDEDEPEYEGHPDREFDNDQIAWYHDDIREWWGIS